MSGASTVRIPMNSKLVVLREMLTASQSRPDAAAQRDADIVAYYVLQAQSGNKRPTVAELVQCVRNNLASGGEPQGDFDYAAWTDLTEKVIVALRSDTPAKSLGRVRVCTVPS